MKLIVKETINTPTHRLTIEFAAGELSQLIDDLYFTTYRPELPQTPQQIHRLQALRRVLMGHPPLPQEPSDDPLLR
jgi:hypothetical protein